MMCGLIDLNIVNNGDKTALPCGSPSSSVASGSLELATASLLPSVSMELWSAVVYFPQEQVEQLPEHPAVAYNLPRHVFCRAVDVKLYADAASDDVCAQVSLISDQQVLPNNLQTVYEGYITDSESSSIRALDLRVGGSRLLAGGSDGQLYVADSYNHKDLPGALDDDLVTGALRLHKIKNCQKLSLLK